jgi:hypothetical protein
MIIFDDPKWQLKMNDYISIIKAQFGGFWNLFFIIGVLVVCLRFSDAEWGTSDLEIRLQNALYLFGSIIFLSAIFAIIRGITLKIKPLQIKYGHPYFNAIMLAAKYGFVTGGVLVTIIGVLMVEDFFKPFNAFIEQLLSIFG